MANRFEAHREIGRTGFRATRLGLGDLADRTLGLEKCARVLRRGLDAGLNVVDTAPAYENGFSEQIVGAALRGRRDGVFLIDKVDELSDPVAPQIEASLGRLGTEPDAFVFHDVSKPETFAALLLSGRFDELLAARAAGRCRFVGLSSHHPDVLRAALADGRCDLLLLPIGPYVDARYVDEILPAARRQGVGTISFKTFGAGKLLGDTEGYGRPLAEGARVNAPLTVAECVRCTLTLEPDVALAGLSTEEEQDAAFDALTRFTPMTRAELDAVRARARDAVVDKGRVWWNPDGR